MGFVNVDVFVQTYFTEALLTFFETSWIVKVAS